jgi:hypothetical protein
MQGKISPRAAGLALGALFSITYVLCVLWGIALPKYVMHSVWAPLLPGFTWLSPGSFILGLVETFVYGVYGGAAFAFLYNYFRGLEGAK